MKLITLKDGRKVAYEDSANPAGKPVLFLHGTGDSRLAKHPDESIAAGLGIRLITVDRSGVGSSTKNTGRTLLDWADDAIELLDQLKIKKLAVAAHSGGGPHAMALASKIPERITKLGLASALGPFDEPGNQKLVENKDLKMVWHLKHLKFLAGVLGAAESKIYLKNPSKLVDSLVKSTPADEPVLNDPVLRPMFEAEMAEALRQMGEGALEDMWAFLDWGFEAADIKLPVEIFYGDSDKIINPKMADVLLKHLKNSRFHNWPGGGHYAVFAHWQEFLKSLV